MLDFDLVLFGTGPSGLPEWDAEIFGAFFLQLTFVLLEFMHVLFDTFYVLDKLPPLKF